MDTPRICAALSDLAYGSPTLDDVAPLGMTWVMNYARGSSQATMTGDGRRVFVAFRGTDQLWDWVADARYVKTGFPGGGRVHKGFYRAFLPLWRVIKRDLQSLDPRLPRIYTGHSLGGAMAQLATAAAGADQVHVFGCPKVGNADFVKRIACTIYRYEAWMDPVTWIPPSWSPVQAVYALGCGRLPSLYRQPGIAVAMESHGHSMSGYRAALEAI